MQFVPTRSLDLRPASSPGLTSGRRLLACLGLVTALAPGAAFAQARPSLGQQAQQEYDAKKAAEEGADEESASSTAIGGERQKPPVAPSDAKVSIDFVDAPL